MLMAVKSAEEVIGGTSAICVGSFTEGLLALLADLLALGESLKLAI